MPYLGFWEEVVVEEPESAEENGMIRRTISAALGGLEGPDREV